MAIEAAQVAIARWVALSPLFAEFRNMIETELFLTPDLMVYLGSSVPEILSAAAAQGAATFAPAFITSVYDMPFKSVSSNEDMLFMTAMLNVPLGQFIDSFGKQWKEVIDVFLSSVVPALTEFEREFHFNEAYTAPVISRFATVPFTTTAQTFTALPTASAPTAAPPKIGATSSSSTTSSSTTSSSTTPATSTTPPAGTQTSTVPSQAAQLASAAAASAAAVAAAAAALVPVPVVVQTKETSVRAAVEFLANAISTGRRDDLQTAVRLLEVFTSNWAFGVEDVRTWFPSASAGSLGKSVVYLLTLMAPTNVAFSPSSATAISGTTLVTGMKDTAVYAVLNVLDGRLSNYFHFFDPMSFTDHCLSGYPSYNNSPNVLAVKTFRGSSTHRTSLGWMYPVAVELTKSNNTITMAEFAASLESQTGKL
jgi:uncharacterized membrane protein